MCFSRPIFLALLTQREPGLCCPSAGLGESSGHLAWKRPPQAESEDPNALLHRQGLLAPLETEGQGDQIWDSPGALAGGKEKCTLSSIGTEFSGRAHRMWKPVTAPFSLTCIFV